MSARALQIPVRDYSAVDHFVAELRPHIADRGLEYAVIAIDRLGHRLWIESRHSTWPLAKRKANVDTRRCV